MARKFLPIILATLGAAGIVVPASATNGLGLYTNEGKPPVPLSTTGPTTIVTLTALPKDNVKVIATIDISLASGVTTQPNQTVTCFFQYTDGTAQVVGEAPAAVFGTDPGGVARLVFPFYQFQPLKAPRNAKIACSGPNQTGVTGIQVNNFFVIAEAVGALTIH